MFLGIFTRIDGNQRLFWIFYAMGLTISSLFNRLFGKRQMRILMGKNFPNISRTASNILTFYSWSWRRWKNYHLVQIEVGRNCHHHSNHWFQCWNRWIQKYQFHRLGRRRSRQNSAFVATLFPKYTRPHIRRGFKRSRTYRRSSGWTCQNGNLAYNPIVFRSMCKLHWFSVARGWVTRRCVACLC